MVVYTYHVKCFPSLGQFDWLTTVRNLNRVHLRNGVSVLTAKFFVEWKRNIHNEVTDQKFYSTSNFNLV